MLTQTHIVFSQAAFYVTCAASGHQPLWWEGLLCALFSVFPADVDHPQSLIGRALPWVSDKVSWYFGHRTITHSLALQLIVALVLAQFVPASIWLPIIVGWVSHSWADMMTPSGVCWFYPSRVRCVLPAHVDYRMEVGGMGEMTFAVIALVVAIVVYPMSMSGQGTTGLIRQSIGDVTAAREQYDRQKGFNQWFVAVEGRDNTKLTQIDGRYKIIAGFGGAGFILSIDGSHFTACQTKDCDWYLTTARLHKGSPETVTVFEYAAVEIERAKLITELQKNVGDVYLIGELATESGKTKLDYSKVSDLPEAELYKNLAIKIQIRNKPTDKPIFTLVSSQPPDKKIQTPSELLNRWL